MGQATNQRNRECFNFDTAISRQYFVSSLDFGERYSQPHQHRGWPSANAFFHTIKCIGEGTLPMRSTSGHLPVNANKRSANKRKRSALALALDKSVC